MQICISAHLFQSTMEQSHISNHDHIPAEITEIVVARPAIKAIEAVPPYRTSLPSSPPPARMRSLPAQPSIVSGELYPKSTSFAEVPISGICALTAEKSQAIALPVNVMLSRLAGE